MASVGHAIETDLQTQANPEDDVEEPAEAPNNPGDVFVGSKATNLSPGGMVERLLQL
jgi:hypothetical protein